MMATGFSPTMACLLGGVHLGLRRIYTVIVPSRFYPWCLIVFGNPSQVDSHSCFVDAEDSMGDLAEERLSALSSRFG